MGRKEVHEVQQMQDPDSGVEQPHAKVEPGSCLARKQLCRKGPELSGGKEVGDPAVCSCSKEN